MSYLSRTFSEKSTTPESILESPPHPTFPKSSPPWRSFHLEAAFHHFETFYLPEVFTTLRPFVSWRSQLWTWGFNNRSSMISVDTYATPSSPTFITCDTSINACYYEQWQIPQYTITPTNVNDHDHYNKFTTCRLCSYSGSSILPPYRHPCHAYMILFLTREGNHFPNPKSAHIHTSHQFTHSYPLRGPSTHLTDNLSLPVLSPISSTDSHAWGS